MTGDPKSSALLTHTDQDLLRAIAAADESALGELYDRHAGQLLALARRILGSTQDAEEILQEVFLHVWQRAGRYDPARSSVPTWLVLITRSRAIDRLRSRKVQERTLAAAQQENPQAAHTSSRGTSNVLSYERRKRVFAGLRELPPEQRDVLELAFYGGMTQSEIARHRDIPLGTVKTRTLLAMKKLRKYLREELRDLL